MMSNVNFRLNQVLAATFLFFGATSMADDRTNFTCQVGQTADGITKLEVMHNGSNFTLNHDIAMKSGNTFEKGCHPYYTVSYSAYYGANFQSLVDTCNQSMNSFQLQNVAGSLNMTLDSLKSTASTQHGYNNAGPVIILHCSSEN